jgi:cellulose synthase/poly-beta-1,6-N-acetylglucosamine synthase-like glycosyltransferase
VFLCCFIISLLQNNFLHRTTFGCHGSFLLTNGALENEITWEIAGLAEDFEFALRARSAGHKCGEVAGIVREQSPETIMDFLKQRRRWFLGMRSIRHPCARYTFFQTSLGLFCNVYNIFDMAMPWLGLFRMPMPVICLLYFQMSVFAYLYLIGIVLQDYDAGYTWSTIVSHVLIGIICIPMCVMLENMAILYAIFFKVKTFEVISK